MNYAMEETMTPNSTYEETWECPDCMAYNTSSGICSVDWCYNWHCPKCEAINSGSCFRCKDCGETEMPEFSAPCKGDDGCQTEEIEVEFPKEIEAEWYRNLLSDIRADDLSNEAVNRFIEIIVSDLVDQEAWRLIEKSTRHKEDLHLHKVAAKAIREKAAYTEEEKKRHAATVAKITADLAAL